MEKPNYKNIYTDIIMKKYPGKMTICETVLQKHTLSFKDILDLNEKIFGKVIKEKEVINKKHRSYSAEDIIRILKFQKENKYNNIQLANHFGLSRNSVAKWNKLFSEHLITK